jgi:hypothetical protein
MRASENFPTRHLGEYGQEGSRGIDSPLALAVVLGLGHSSRCVCAPQAFLDDLSCTSLPGCCWAWRTILLASLRFLTPKAL